MEYTLKLRLSENVHSDDNGYNTNETDPFKNKSNLNTKKGRNAPLETVCDALEGILIEDNPKKIRQHNLFTSEENAIKSLLIDYSF